MKAAFYVAISAKKFGSSWYLKGVPKCTATKPSSIGADTVAVKISVEIPDSYFNDPRIEVALKLPDRPSTIAKVEMEKLIGETLEQQLGLKVHVSADLPEVVA